MFKYIALIALVVSPAWCYSEGAPQKICHSTNAALDLFPQHGGVKSQTSPSPYSITGSDVVKAGQPATFKLAGRETIKGFIIQARDDSQTPKGAFRSSANSQTIKCLSDNDTLTHTKITSKTLHEVQFQWTPPANLKGKSVTLVGTVVQNGATFWVKKTKKTITIA